jgi:hypothetical protein
MERESQDRFWPISDIGERHQSTLTCRPGCSQAIAENVATMVQDILGIPAYFVVVRAFGI